MAIQVDAHWISQPVFLALFPESKVQVLNAEAF